MLKNEVLMLSTNNNRKMKKLLLTALIFPFMSQAQPLKIRKNQSGMFSLGVRTTLSTFNGGDFGNNGFGVGGQYRLQFADRINSDWFFDYITSDVDDFAKRTDYHIGVSIMSYFTKKPFPFFKPYLVAGYCFDWTDLVATNDASNRVTQRSSAVQAGAGFHLNLSERMDLSFVSQYMIHLGGDFHAHRHDDGSVGFEKHEGAGLEGHLLFHIGINYKIADLWGRN